MISIKRRIRSVELSAYFLLEKQYRLFGIPVSPWMVDWPEPLWDYKCAIKAMLFREGLDNDVK